MYQGYAGTMSAEAPFIVTTLFTFSHLSFGFDSERMMAGYAGLYDYVGEHPEAGEIARAIA
ncbi:MULTISPECIES: antirestriction protein [unclassified Haematobacter]|uniref:antirestriction protein n=1 Tax=unclassified Haematobacter TaxID=2640585 RepID=UPI0025BFA9D4|nr:MULTISPECIES: antirestriction protein [unclassified Haematobacter]